LRKQAWITQKRDRHLTDAGKGIKTDLRTADFIPPLRMRKYLSSSAGFTKFFGNEVNPTGAGWIFPNEGVKSGSAYKMNIAGVLNQTLLIKVS